MVKCLRECEKQGSCDLRRDRGGDRKTKDILDKSSNLFCPLQAPKSPVLVADHYLTKILLVITQESRNRKHIYKIRQEEDNGCIMALELYRGENEVYWVGAKLRNSRNRYTWLQIRADVIRINQTKKQFSFVNQK